MNGAGLVAKQGLPCYDLSPLAFHICLIGLVYIVTFEEGDGRCVRASWPDSTRLSTPGLLLNPPLTSCFMEGSVWLLGILW